MQVSRVIKSVLALTFVAASFMTPREVKAQTTSSLLRRVVSGSRVSKAKLYRVLWKVPLTKKDLQYHSHETTRYLRNAIFALQGARFVSPELRKLFGKQRWYRPYRSTRQIRLSRTARRNLLLLRKVEARLIAKRKAELMQTLWGEKPLAVVLYGPRTCLRYAAYQVVQTENAIRIARSHPGNPCRIRSRNVVLTLSRERNFEMKGEFRGLSGSSAFFWGLGSSDMQDLLVISLRTQKKLFHRKQMNPVANIRFSAKTQRLSFFQDVKRHPSCKMKSEKVGGMLLLALQLPGCWKAMVQKHSYLKGMKAPVCRCSGGLGPYLTARFAWSPKAPKAKPVFVGKLKCGCSS
ncbi:MAG: YARHG domain-containing protein [Deltaproteobacteria bacterium]|nr:MAG: YARHG domain-containing protein [Deltaproteobacteria bacterium]